MKLEIEFDLVHNRVFLTTPYSHEYFSDTESDRARLFRALRAVAHYRAAIARAEARGESVHDVAAAILAYDAEQLAKRYDEKGKLDLTKLEIDL